MTTNPWAIEIVADARALPAAYRGDPQNPQFAITRRWRDGSRIGACWAGAAVTGAGAALMFLATPATLFGGVYAAALAVVLFYIGACFAVERTVVAATDGVLEVRHGPLPWFGRQRISTDGLRQLRAGPSTLPGDDGFEILAVRDDGTVVRLVADLRDGDEAEYFARSLSEHLGLR